MVLMWFLDGLGLPVHVAGPRLAYLKTTLAKTVGFGVLVLAVLRAKVCLSTSA